MELQHLVTFKTVVKEGSFTAAGGRLGYTQSAITNQMKQLERDLNIKLFDKIKNRMVPTQAGYELLKYINEIIDITERMKAMYNPSDSIRGTLHIGIPAHLALSRLCLALKKFQEMAPYVNVVVSNYHSISTIHKMVYDGEVDVAFTEDYTRSTSDLEVTTLECSRLCLIAGPLMDLSTINVSQPGKPMGCGIVLNQKDAVYRKLFEDYLRIRQIVPTSTTEFWGIEVVKRFVQLGGGITLLPQSAIESELEHGDLVELRPLEPFPSIYINMTVLKSKWESPQLHLFKQVINECFTSPHPAIDEIKKKVADAKGTKLNDLTI
ncbi:MAG: LysR family transcriptional regulator [Lachnospiraceae bacterium]|nr:LysR family transcriptional regulator [Lachnospiraceae bacterium]